LLECGSSLIPQEENFGRGDGLQRVIQFWKIKANDIATRRFCLQKKLASGHFKSLLFAPQLLYYHPISTELIAQLHHYLLYLEH
jgi:hypothetical protein